MEIIDHKIRRLIRYYVRLTGTRDPVAIARAAGIPIVILPLGEIAGTYMLLKRKRWIFINENIPTDSPLSVCGSHELATLCCIEKKIVPF